LIAVVPLKLRTALFTALLLSRAAAMSAQTVPHEPDPNRVRIRIGPILLNPSIALTNAGVDTNVFNEEDSTTPESDFTLTVTPKTDVFMRVGRTWLTGAIIEDLVWYKKFSSERSANNNYAATWLVPLTRIAFAVGGNWVSTRERPGFEIDARSQRTERAGNAGIELRALSKTFMGVKGEQRKIEFDRAALFLGNNLHEELTRTITTGAVSLRHQLTPLTSVGVSAGREQERFEFSPLRDSDSDKVDFALAFDPFALINGSATFGYRNFKPASPDVPGYSGSTLGINLSYVALGSTRISATGTRDVQNSYDISEPYYLLTGFTVALAQQIYGPLDVQVRVGSQKLAYRDRIGAVVAVSDRVDRVRSYGGGFGYRVGRDLRVGFNVDKQTRKSDLVRRRYDGLRYGMAVTYGL
jgi:hypothetical protein